MKSTKVSLSVLGVAVLSACSTVSVKDTSGVTATNRMFNYYLEQTKQAFNDLAEHEHTTTYHVNEQLIEQSVLNAAARVDEANDLLGNTPAVEPKGAVMAAAEEVEAIVPAANIGSQLSWPLFIAGLIFSIDPLVTLGIVLFSLAVLFQLVTLPVEINASSRALKMLESTGILGADEKKGARKVLTAAALTYVAALAASILQLLRLIILAGGRDRD